MARTNKITPAMDSSTTGHISTMKYLIIICCLLGGCTFMRAYDPVEYNHINDLVTLADISSHKCRSYEGQKEIADQLSIKMTYIMNYVKHSYANAYSYDTLTNVEKIINEFYLRVSAAQTSTFYCKSKLQMISISAGEVEYTLGNMR